MPLPDNQLLLKTGGVQLMETNRHRGQQGQQYYVLEKSVRQQFTWTQAWANLVQQVLPRLESLECSSDDWTEKGFVSLMTVLKESTTTTLTHLKLSFPAHLLGASSNCCAALKDFLSHNALESIHLVNVFPHKINRQQLRQPFQPAQNTDGAALVNIHPRLPLEGQGYEQPIRQFFQAICGSPCLPKLSLSCFPWIPSPAVSQLNAKNLILETCRLRRSSPEQQISNTNPPEDDIWNAVARIQTSPWNFSMEYNNSNTANSTTATSDSRSLASLRLLAHAPTMASAADTATLTDITRVVTKLMQLTTLTSLQVVGRHLKLQLAPIFQLLQTNTSLTCLQLMGMYFFIQDDKNKIPSLFLEVLKSNNTTLERLSVFDSSVVYALNESCFLRPHHFVDYRTSCQIQYYCLLNQFGRKQLRDSASASRMQLVASLIQAKVSDNTRQPHKHWQHRYYGLPRVRTLEEGPEPERDPRGPRRPVRPGAPLQPSAPEAQEEFIMEPLISLLYGLLHESPELWCLGHLFGSEVLTGSKRKAS